MIVDVCPEEVVTKSAVEAILAGFMSTIEHQREQIDLLTRQNIDLRIELSKNKQNCTGCLKCTGDNND